ncbi:TonB family protein [Rhodophyticola sp.]|jgi:protein TonB|uniref:energy transducer TonB n=1 Tax=Rhodophyticola sp. TaxID=2680032 RepID=UPI003D2D00BB
MNRLLQIFAFLTVSVAVHAAVFVQLSDGAASRAGPSGAAETTFQAASGEMAELVARWTTPPDVAQPSALAPPSLAQLPVPPTPTDAAPRPAMPDALRQPVLPEPVPTVPNAETRLSSLPDIRVANLTSPELQSAPQTALPPPEMVRRAARPELALPPMSDTAPGPVPDATSPLAVAHSDRPVARPERPEAPAPAMAAQARQTAGEQRGDAARGNVRQASDTTISASQRQSLVARWGAQIEARIERRRPNVGGQQGAVTLRLNIGRDGHLQSLALIQSSGNPEIDEAGIRAVRRAGRFPAAPDGLSEQSYRFDLPIRFR